ncbi:MAG: hemolysin III family protein, partial [Pseudomonadota bacterium]
MIRSRLGVLSVEEFANTITHGFGLILSVIGFAVLIVVSALKESLLSITGCVIYGSSLIVLYGAS